MDVSPGRWAMAIPNVNASHKGKGKRAKTHLRDVVDEAGVRRSGALLSLSVLPVMAQLLGVLMEQLTPFLQDYCSRLTQILRKQQASLSEAQSVAILADVFFIASAAAN